LVENKAVEALLSVLGLDLRITRVALDGLENIIRSVPLGPVMENNYEEDGMPADCGSNENRAKRRRMNENNGKKGGQTNTHVEWIRSLGGVQKMKALVADLEARLEEEEEDETALGGASLAIGQVDKKDERHLCRGVFDDLCRLLDIYFGEPRRYNPKSLLTICLNYVRAHPSRFDTTTLPLDLQESLTETARRSKRKLAQ
jgi:hypothetical protein